MRNGCGNAGCLFPDTARRDDDDKRNLPALRVERTGRVTGRDFRPLFDSLSIVADQLVIETFLVKVERMDVHAAERGETV